MVPADHIGLYHNGRSPFFFGEGGMSLDFEANPDHHVREDKLRLSERVTVRIMCYDHDIGDI